MVYSFWKHKVQMCDGYTSSSILWLYIKQWYPNANLYFTIHEGKQHGLSDKVDWLEEQDFNLIICPDSASFDKDEMERLALIPEKSQQLAVNITETDEWSIKKDHSTISVL